MPDSAKNEQPQDRLTIFQTMANQTVRRWLVYITYYVVAIILVIITTHIEFNSVSSFFEDLTKEPVILLVALMPPLLMVYLRWSVMDLVTQLHNLDSDMTPLQESLFEEADSFSESTIVGNTFKLHSLLKRMIDSRLKRMQRDNLQISIEIRDDVPNKLFGQSAILKKVLGELLNCAIKKTDQGAIYISVKVLEKSGADLLIRFEVGGTGDCEALSSDKIIHYEELLTPVGGQICKQKTKNSGQTTWFTMMLQKQHKQTVAA